MLCKWTLGLSLFWFAASVSAAAGGDRARGAFDHERYLGTAQILVGVAAGASIEGAGGAHPHDLADLDPEGQIHAGMNLESVPGIKSDR